jgi:hypothetical protein
MENLNVMENTSIVQKKRTVSDFRFFLSLSAIMAMMMISIVMPTA